MSSSKAQRVLKRIRNLCPDTVKHYTTDWDIDRQTIERIFNENINSQFVHVAREHGTYLFVVLENDLDRVRPYLFGTTTGRHILSQYAELFAAENTRHWGRHKIHYFNGKIVRPICGDEARRLFNSASTATSRLRGDTTIVSVFSGDGVVR